MKFFAIVTLAVSLLLAAASPAASNPPAPWCMFNPCSFQYVPFHGFRVFLD